MELDDATIIERLGGPSAVARLCGEEVTPQAVSQWDDEGRRIPPGWRNYLKAVRPDVFSPDWQPTVKAA